MQSIVKNETNASFSQKFSNFLTCFKFCTPKKGLEPSSNLILPKKPTSQMDINAQIPDYDNHKISKHHLENLKRFRERYHYAKSPFPENQTFVFGGEYKIIAKFTKKQIKSYMSDVFAFKSLQLHSSNPTSPKMTSNLLQPRVSSRTFLQEENIHFRLRASSNTSLEEEEILSPRSQDDVTSYIAYRLKCDIIIEASCNLGYNSHKVLFFNN